MTSSEPHDASVLVVEDHADLRSVLQTVFELEGFNVLSAGNGLAALTLVAEHGIPAVVVTDLHMPDMDGQQFIRALDERITTSPSPVTRPLIIICTAEVNRGEWASLADHVIIKCGAQFFDLPELARDHLARRVPSPVR